MQRKPRHELPQQPPSPHLAWALSLFGYPGLGHWWLGYRREALLYFLGFTLTTLASLYQAWLLLPTLATLWRQAVDLQPLTLPPFPRLTPMAAWIGLSLLLWLASGWRAARLAQRASTSA